MTSLKHAFKVDVSPITSACALLAREAWDTDEPDSRDHWKAAALKARVHADGLANELSRLRELEVKWLRAMEREQYVKELLTLLVVPPADMHAVVSSDAVFGLSLRVDNYGYLDNPVTEVDLERFRKQMPR